VVGATRESGSGFDARVTADGQRQVLEDALSIAPGLADATLIETRVGLRPVADGELPIVGALDGMDGVFVNAGFGAAGLTMGPVVGDRLAALIVRENPAPVDGFLSGIPETAVEH
jgi:D-amino-acid dehydrogenase